MSTEESVMRMGGGAGKRGGRRRCRVEARREGGK